MARRVHFPAFERLSAEGQMLLLRGVREKWTLAKSCKELKLATGEIIAESSLQRFIKTYEAQMRNLDLAREQALVVLREFQGGSVTAEQTAAALVAQALFDARDGLKDADPIDLSREERERQKLRLKQQEIDIRREQLEFDKQKLEAMERKQAAVKAAAEGVKEIVEGDSGELTPEQRRKVRELYGLATE